MLNDFSVKDELSNLRNWKHKGNYHQATVTRTRTTIESKLVFFSKTTVDVVEIDIFAEGMYDRHPILLEWRDQATGELIDSRYDGAMNALTEQYRFKYPIEQISNAD